MINNNFSSSSGGDNELPHEDTKQRAIRLKRLEKFDNTGNSST